MACALPSLPPPPLQVDMLCFRPNLVVSGFGAFEEDTWRSCTVGPLSCQVLGGCPRCAMIQVSVP